MNSLVLFFNRRVNSKAECASPPSLAGKLVSSALRSADWCEASADPQLILVLSAVPFLLSTLLLILAVIYR